MDLALSERRMREADRLARIKDPKLYNKVNVDALAAQIAEKKATKVTEAAYQVAADRETLMMDQQLVYLEQERRRIETMKLHALDDYRHSLQGKTTTREFDLQDPTALRREQPARISDEDERLGASSVQKFHGEDLSHSHRIKTQQDELREWCAEAMAEKAYVKAQKAQEDSEFAASMMEIDMLKTHLEASASTARKGTTSAVAEYNLAQAQAKKQRERAAQIAEVQDPHPYVLNRYSRIPGTQPHENEYHIPPGEPCIRQEHDHNQGYCIHKTGYI